MLHNVVLQLFAAWATAFVELNPVNNAALRTSTPAFSVVVGGIRCDCLYRIENGCLQAGLVGESVVAVAAAHPYDMVECGIAVAAVLTQPFLIEGSFQIENG